MTARPRGGDDDARLGVAHADQVAAFREAEKRAVRVVAGRSADVDECRELLGMLGLERAAGVTPLIPGADDPDPADEPGTAGAAGTPGAADAEPGPTGGSTATTPAVDLDDARGTGAGSTR